MKNAERMIHRKYNFEQSNFENTIPIALLAADEKPGSHSDLNLEELENLKLPNDAANEVCKLY